MAPELRGLPASPGRSPGWHRPVTARAGGLHRPPETVLGVRTQSPDASSGRPLSSTGFPGLLASESELSPQPPVRRSAGGAGQGAPKALALVSGLTAAHPAGVRCLQIYGPITRESCLPPKSSAASGPRGSWRMLFANLFISLMPCSLNLWY